MRGVTTVTAETITMSGRIGGSRNIPSESPVAIEVNGIGYAVMMASPTDLEDFGTGFALSEGFVDEPDEIRDITLLETETGWVLRIGVSQDRMPDIAKRVRLRVSDSSCGLCGLENLEQVARPLPRVTARIDLADAALFRAVSTLSEHQPLNVQTGGVHAAAFCQPDGTVLIVREDVGRHNALDKLIGALARAGTSAATGFFLLSSRCSYELVEKTVIAGCPALITISVATSLAVQRAREAGLKLVALARSDSMLDFSEP